MTDKKIAHEFFTLIVKPTVEEYIKEPYNIRRARLSAIVLSHMIDYWGLRDNKSTDRSEMDKIVRSAKEELCEKIPSYRIIIDLADASKHAKLAVPKNKNNSRTLYDANALNVPHGIFQAPLGYGGFAEYCTAYVTLEDGSSHDILETSKIIIKEWQFILNIKQ